MLFTLLVVATLVVNNSCKHKMRNMAILKYIAIFTSDFAGCRMPINKCYYLKPNNLKMNNKKNSPIKWVPSLYFAMGLPFVVLNMVTSLMYSGMGVSDAKITFWTGLIMLPWTLKPLWSPLLELFKTKKYFVVLTQMISGALFGLVALSLQLPDFFAYSIAIMAVIAFSGATHDIAADGLYISVLDKSQQAEYIGWQGAFYNISKIVATGGFVYLAGALKESVGVTMAWMTIMGLCGLTLFLLGLYHIKMLPSTPRVDKGEVKSFGESMFALKEVFSCFFQKKYIWYYLLFIIMYRFGEGFVMKIVPLFLSASRDVQGLGLTEQQIGLYYGTFGAAAFVLGSLLAGYYISRRGLKRTIFTLCCAFNMPFIAYALLAFFQPDSMLFVGSAIVVEYFGYGFGFVGLTLFMMQQIAPGKHQMAHYAFASGIMNLGVMIPGMLSGTLSDALGYKLFFIVILFATIPAFFLTWFLPFTHDETKEISEEV